MTKPRRAASAAMVFVLVALGNRFAAGDVNESQVAVLLQREIVGRQRALEEVRAFCDARVSRMPPIVSAAQWDEEAQRLRAAVLEQIVYRGRAAAVARRDNARPMAGNDR